MTFSETLLQYSLFVAMVTMGAAAVYFYKSSERVPEEYKDTMTLSALIVGVATVMYFFMATRYEPGKEFPVLFRYADWALTTPLLVLKFPDLIKARARGLAITLIIADLFMVFTGFYGEIQGTEGDGVFWRLVWGAISTLGYLVILYIVFGPLARVATSRVVSLRRGYRAMSYFVAVAWGVYPIVYILKIFHNINQDYLQMASTAADIVNKVVFGAVIFFAIRAFMEEHNLSKDIPLHVIRNEPATMPQYDEEMSDADVRGRNQGRSGNRGGGLQPQ